MLLVKGPSWKTAMGDFEYDPFNHYRIQLFNGQSLLSIPHVRAELLNCVLETTQMSGPGN
jgi:hypothetical protein